MKIGKIENRSIKVAKQVERNGIGRPLEQLSHMVDSLEVGQCFSIDLEPGDDKNKLRERLSSTRTHSMKKKSCRFSIRFEDGKKFTVYRVE